MTQQLSPAAQAVTDAYLSTPIKHGIKSPLAAALRAAADQIGPLSPVPPKFASHYEEGMWDAADDAKDKLLAIADELEAQ